jgi:hypothetical protein
LNTCERIVHGELLISCSCSFCSRSVVQNAEESLKEKR